MNNPAKIDFDDPNVVMWQYRAGAGIAKRYGITLDQLKFQECPSPPREMLQQGYDVRGLGVCQPSSAPPHTLLEELRHLAQLGKKYHSLGPGYYEHIIELIDHALGAA